MLWSLSQTQKQPIALDIYFLWRGDFYTSDSHQCTFVCKPTVLGDSSWWPTRDNRELDLRNNTVFLKTVIFQYVCTLYNNQIRAMNISIISILLSVTEVKKLQYHYFTYFET